MNRKSRSLRRVSSILKIDKDDETGILGNRSKRNSRRVSFAETYQVKEIPRNSPRCYKDVSDSENEENQQPNNQQGAQPSITGLDKLLTGVIQTPYQDIVSECSVPEMSMGSFNIFDSNRTIMDPVDMDTTAAGGGICLPDMDFQSEPSTEIRLDHMAFLQTLSNSNSSLKPMQIYSPNREKQASVLSERMNQSLQETETRSPLTGLNTQQSTSLYDHNKENIIVHTDMLPSYQPTVEEPPSPYDVKNFFTNLFGPKTSVGDDVENMDGPNCYVGIQGNTYKSNLDHILPGNSDSIRSEGFQYNDNNVTTVFGCNTVFNGVEETRCIGGILNQSINTKPQFEDADTTLNITMPMEITKPVGFGVGSKAPDTTLNMTEPMEITKPVGLSAETTDVAIAPTGNQTLIRKSVGLSAVPKDVAFTKATSMDSALNVSVRNQATSINEISSVPGVYSNQAGVVGDNFAQDMDDVEMEETKPLPGVIENVSIDATLTNKTLSTEETKMVGGILDKSSISKPVAQLSQNVILNQSSNQASGAQITSDLARNRTANLTLGMEETVAVGGILNTSATAPHSISQVEEINFPEQTKDITMCMEETRALGAILKSGEATLDMGKIRASKTWGDGERTVCIGDAMEETRPLGGLVKEFGKKLAETSILERTVTFEKFDADWTANQLKQNKRITVESGGGAANTSVRESVVAGLDRTSGNVTSFEPVSMEETVMNTSRIVDTEGSRIDSIETANKSIAERNQTKLGHTVLEPQTMEETRCITRVLQIQNDGLEHNSSKKEIKREITFSNKSDPDPMQCENDIFVDEDIVFKKSSVDLTAEMDLTNITNTALTNCIQDNSSASPETLPDSECIELSSKASNKRSYGVIRETGQDIEKTQDLTQSQGQFAKLREMLINSKKKTAVHLRSGELRTPSKLSMSNSKYTPTTPQTVVSTGSPAYKKQRVESENEGLNVNQANISHDNPANLSQMDKALGDSEGIDEEQMPDDMRDLHGTLCSTETPSEHSQASSENKTSSSINMSLVSNKSFATSFNIPEGPLTLESFYSLTIRPPTKLKIGRCSLLFTPKIDMDSLEEVLSAQLTVKPLVEAKKVVEKSMLEKIAFNKETQEWLQKTLEETQPQIFCDCSQATANELQTLRDELRVLSKCCRETAAATWKQDTAKMVKEALDQIKDESSQKADNILKVIQESSDSVDQMLTSLDAELAELDLTETQLLELQQRQDSLSQHHEASVKDLEEKSQIADRLAEELNQVEEASVFKKEREEIRQQVLAQFMCVDWTLDDYQEDHVVFTFNNDQLELKIDYVPLTKEKTIKHIELRRTDTQVDLCPYEELCQLMIMCAVDTESLLRRYPCFADLPQMLREVSAIVTEIKQFYTELKKINFKHKLKVAKNRVEFELWNIETLDLIKLGLVFDAMYPLSKPVSSDVHITQGNLRSDAVQTKIFSVAPGRKYLARLIEAIDFKDLHRSTS